MSGLRNTISAFAQEHTRMTKAAPPPEDATAARLSAKALEALTNGVAFDTSTLTELLVQIRADAYLAGAHVAQGQVGGGAVTAAGLGQISTSIDWDAWEPGWPQAAEKLSGADGSEGLKGLLDDAGVTIKDVDDTTLSRLATALADGVQAGDSVDTISGSVESVLDDGDMSRATAIANTEVNRAMTQASLDTYAANDVEQFNWVIEDDACPECQDEADGNPHDMSDTAPPEHPNCRCAVSPIVNIGGGNQPDDEEDE